MVLNNHHAVYLPKSLGVSFRNSHSASFSGIEGLKNTFSKAKNTHRANIMQIIKDDKKSFTQKHYNNMEYMSR